MNSSVSEADLVQVVLTGNLRAKFDGNNLLDLFEWTTSRHEEYVSLQDLEASALESPDLKQSPSMSKNAKRAAQQKQKEQAAREQARHITIPKPSVNDMGLTPAVMECLEVS